MTHSIRNCVIFACARCNRMVAKQEHYHSTVPTGKQINEGMLQPPTPLHYCPTTDLVISPTGNNGKGDATALPE